MSDFLFIRVDLGKQVVHFVCNFSSAGQAPNYRTLAGGVGVRLAQLQSWERGNSERIRCFSSPHLDKSCFPLPSSSDVLEKASECVDNSIKFWRARYG